MYLTSLTPIQGQSYILTRGQWPLLNFFIYKNINILIGTYFSNFVQ